MPLRTPMDQNQFGFAQTHPPVCDLGHYLAPLIECFASENHDEPSARKQTLQKTLGPGPRRRNVIANESASMAMLHEQWRFKSRVRFNRVSGP
ncbi:MAG: hypothetical protein HY300_12965 [Verrucomicrobia bacterium]|nr:hypothetical protein [Verrucomicrobiota bacterium]